MPLPLQYEWLSKEPGPRMVLEGLKLFGTVESAGSKNNPIILSWADEVGGTVDKMYQADENSMVWFIYGCRCQAR